MFSLSLYLILLYFYYMHISICVGYISMFSVCVKVKRLLTPVIMLAL